MLAGKNSPMPVKFLHGPPDSRLRIAVLDDTFFLFFCEVLACESCDFFKFSSNLQNMIYFEIFFEFFFHI